MAFEIAIRLLNRILAVDSKYALVNIMLMDLMKLSRTLRAALATQERRNNKQKHTFSVSNKIR